jgi:hypothetical protein
MSDGAVFEEPMGAIVPGNGGVSIFCELFIIFNSMVHPTTTLQYPLKYQICNSVDP